MENIKLPIALVAAMAAQLAGGVWWVSQQSATIYSLEETVSQLGSKMAIEDNINLRRDVQSNTEELNEIWIDMNGVMERLNAILDLQQRVALLEVDLEYMRRDHSNMRDQKGPMK